MNHGTLRRDQLGPTCLCLLAGLVLAAAASANEAAPSSYAEQITAENAGRLRVGGSDALGGIGDWALGNGVLCAVVSDPSHESHLTPQGGVLIDLVRCGVAHDEWITLEGLLNMSRDRMLGASWIRADPDRPDGSVALVTGARVQGLDIVTTYSLGPDRPDALRIETRATRLWGSDGDERAFLFGYVVLHGRRQLAPFSLQLEPDGSGVRPAGSVGFAHPTVDPEDMLTMVQAILPADLHVLVGGDRQQPGVSYGLQLTGARLVSADGSERPLPFLSINGESFTMQGVFTRPLYFGGDGGTGQGGIGLLELAQTLLMDLSPGESIVLEREIRVGGRADVASVTDQIFRDQPLVRGRAAATARLHVSTADGTPVTEVRPAADGSFAFRLRPGKYRMTVLAPARRERALSFEVSAAGAELGELSLPDPGWVVLPRGRPMRLVFSPASEATRVRFGDDLLGFRVGDERYRGSQFGGDVSLSGSPADPGRLAMVPGLYDVIATRGPEFDLTRARIEVTEGSETPLEIASPTRVLEHPGWVSADLHVHSEWSDDSSFPAERQLAAFVAEGADLIVSTEHDRVADYAPLIGRLSLDSHIRSLVGVEVTSSAHAGASPHTAGHSNVFPMPYEPLAYRGGAPAIEGRRLRDMMGDVRSLPGDRLVQLNHPRRAGGKGNDLNFFTHLSIVGEPFLPSEPLSAWPNQVLLEPSPDTGLRDLDFDLIELWNGESMAQYRAVRADWYALLLQGEFRPAVANSDSHVHRELVAYPRTYVRVRDGRDDDEAFISSLRAGRAYGSSGPQLSVVLLSEDGQRTGLGGLHLGSTATLQVQVRAAPWVPVSRLRVYANGRLAHEGPIGPASPAVLRLDFPVDAFVTVEVSGKAGADYAIVAPGFQPFAFSNPIFVDADGDGSFTAPGLPATPLPILDPTRTD